MMCDAAFSNVIIDFSLQNPGKTFSQNLLAFLVDFAISESKKILLLISTSRKRGGGAISKTTKAKHVEKRACAFQKARMCGGFISILLVFNHRKFHRCNRELGNDFAT